MKINFQNKNIWKGASVLMIALMLTTFNQCVVQEYNLSEKDVNAVVDEEEEEEVVDVPVGGSGEFTETGATEVARTITSVGIKDFEEVYYTMSVVTGIDPADEGSIRNTYSDLRTQLPFDASIKQYTTANQIAVIKLGAEFCHILFSKSQYYNNFFNNFNIAQSPSQSIVNEASKDILITEFINKFWGQNTQPIEVENTAREELSFLIDDLLMGENLNSSATTRDVAKGVCSSMIASAPLVLL
jgi:hypothetical protein